MNWRVAGVFGTAGVGKTYQVKNTLLKDVPNEQIAYITLDTVQDMDALIESFEEIFARTDFLVLWIDDIDTYFTSAQRPEEIMKRFVRIRNSGKLLVYTAKRPAWLSPLLLHITDLWGVMAGLTEKDREVIQEFSPSVQVEIPTRARVVNWYSTGIVQPMEAG